MSLELHDALTTGNVYPSREAWLMAAALGLKPWFNEVNNPLIVPIRLTVGFPSTGALANKKRRVGECWDVAASQDGHAEIMISPLLDDPMEVLGVVAHELGHAVLGSKVGHKKPFANLMIALNLEGKVTSTFPGERFKTRALPLLEALGPFPHARLRPMPKEDKKEKVKLFKTTCPRCGYVARVIRRWLEDAGAPVCPLDRVTMEEG